MNTYEETWETYAKSWKVTSVDAKRALYEKALHPDCQYTDPTTQTQGWDELLAYMQVFHQTVPGGHFVTREFMAHHARSVAKWEMRDANGTVIGDGVSFGEYDAHGKLRAMTGFFQTAEN